MNAGKINPRLFGIAQMPPPHPRIAENCSMLRPAAAGTGQTFFIAKYKRNIKKGGFLNMHPD